MSARLARPSSSLVFVDLQVHEQGNQVVKIAHPHRLGIQAPGIGNEDHLKVTNRDLTFLDSAVKPRWYRLPFAMIVSFIGSE